MNRWIMGAIIALTAATQSVAEEVDPRIARWAALGPGVHDVKKNASGGMQSCIVVGQARISTAFGVARGRMDAQRNARLSAEAEFVRWLQSNVQAVIASGNEQVLVLESAGGQRTETGRAVETNSEEIRTAAEGAVRGLTVLGSLGAGGEGEGVYTLVLGWSPSTAGAAAEAGRLNQPVQQQQSAQGASGTGSQSGSAASGGTSKLQVPSWSAVSPALDDF
jgi:hypothetical protein